MNNFDCVTIGGSVLDTFVMLTSVQHHTNPDDPTALDQCFALGAKIDVEKIIQQSGGGASNASVTFARQRLSCALISVVGDDAVGHMVADELRADGVHTQHIDTVKGGKTGQSVILVDQDAERTIFTDRGSGTVLPVQQLDVLPDIKVRYAYVTSQGGSEKVLNTIFTWSRTSHSKIAWNPGKADFRLSRSLLQRYVSQSDLLLLNRVEAAEMLGHTGTADELASQLHRFGASRAVITDGDQSLAVLDGNRIWMVEPNNVKAVDQTGAGDAFGSGTVAGLLHGLSFDRAVEFGLLNSEHVVMHIGAKTGIMYRK